MKLQNKQFARVILGVYALFSVLFGTIIIPTITQNDTLYAQNNIIADTVPLTHLAATGDLSGDCQGDELTKDNCGIIAYLLLFINVLSGLVGIVIVIMITVGGIQYSTARDSPQAAAAAKTRIANALLALVVYLFMFAFLQYIVPGGVL